MKSYPQPTYQRPPGATEILLVRHGQSRAAVPGKPFVLLNGQGNPELSDLGQVQAQRISQRLGDEPIDALYVTNLRRTHETAAPLASRLGLVPVEEAELREVHMGEWEGGQFRIKVHNNDPIYQVMLEQQRWDVIPGAEPHSAINHRVSSALNRIIARHPDQLVVCVVHGGIVGHILAEITGSAPFAFYGCDNGSISHIVALEGDIGGKVTLRGYNDTAHLVDVESDALPT